MIRGRAAGSGARVHSRRRWTAVVATAASESLLHAGDRARNGVGIVSMLRSQISGLDELRDHLVGMNPAGKKRRAAGQSRQSYAKRYVTALKIGICALGVECRCVAAAVRNNFAAAAPAAWRC
jgi:hypothetical protein